MRRGWLAGLILSFSLLTVVLGTSLGQSPEGRFQGLSPDDVIDIRGMHEMFRSFQKPLPGKAYAPLLGRSEGLSDPELFEDTVKKLYPGLLPEIENGSSKRAEVIPLDRTKKGDTWHYLLSFSMPRDSIKRALSEAAGLRAEGIPVVMALRGFVDNKFKTTAVRVYSLLKELEVDVPFEIDPELFEDAGIEAYPPSQKKVPGSCWGMSASGGRSKS